MDFMQFLAGGVLGLLVSEYVLSKKEFHYHALAVLFVGWPYIVMGYVPQWLNETAVRSVVIILHGLLISRAVRMCNPKVSRAILYIAILAFVGWTLVRAFA